MTLRTVASCLTTGSSRSWTTRKRRIEWTESAQRDLQQIYDWIARDSRVYARRMIRRIKLQVEGARIFPEGAPTVVEWNREDIRETYEGSYRIIFRIEESRLVVLAVIHGARLIRDEARGDESGDDDE